MIHPNDENATVAADLPMKAAERSRIGSCATSALAAVLLAATAPVLAQTAQPYSGQESRSVAALSSERIAGLRSGAGLGYAKAAELNGWPGPAHVLELSDALDLSPEIREEIEAIRSRMLAEAVPLGVALIEVENALDALFSADMPDADAVAAATDKAARVEGRLRAVHLSAHLETTPLLTRHQRMIYARARGYDGRGDAVHDH